MIVTAKSEITYGMQAEYKFPQQGTTIIEKFADTYRIDGVKVSEKVAKAAMEAIRSGNVPVDTNTVK